MVMNYGLWLINTPEDCGQHKGTDSCPYIPEVCEFLTGQHPFQVIWQTTTPKQAHRHSPLGEMTEEHHLHIPRVCNLASDSFINRGELLHALEPDNEKRKDLYHDDAHFTPAPYHAFNGYLVEMIAGQDLGHGELISSNGGPGEEADKEQSTGSKTENIDIQEQGSKGAADAIASTSEEQQQIPDKKEQIEKDVEVHVASVHLSGQGSDRLRAAFG